MGDIEDFMYVGDEKKVADVPAVSISKKRKKPSIDQSGRDELKQQARLHCSCPQQWKSVSKYSQNRMTEFVLEKEFESQQALYDNIFGFAHQVLALAMDKVMFGNGFVQEEIESNTQIQQSIKQEFSNLTQFLNNRCKLLMLTGISAVNGKRAQLAAEPKETVTIIEEIQDDEQPPPRQHEGEADSQAGPPWVVPEDILEETDPAVSQD